MASVGNGYGYRPRRLARSAAMHVDEHAATGSELHGITGDIQQDLAEAKRSPSYQRGGESSYTAEIASDLALVCGRNKSTTPRQG